VIRKIIFALILGITSLSCAVPAQAASQVIPVLPLAPQISTHLSAYDDIAAALVTPQSAYVIGTLESSTATIVSQPTLGGSSDGYITSLSWSGALQWSTRLGGSSDDIATAITTDNLGNLWVVGASNVLVATPTPAPTPSNIFNPQHINITPVTPPTTGLRKLQLWEISPATGIVMASYNYNFSNIIEPQGITFKNNKFAITGISNDPQGANFLITATTLGVFSHPKFFNQAPVTTSALTFIKSASYLWESYLATQGIPGIPAFKPKAATTVLIRSSIKTGKLESLYTIAGTLTSLEYQKGAGLLIVSKSASDYGINLIKTP